MLNSKDFGVQTGEAEYSMVYLQGPVGIQKHTQQSIYHSKDG